MCFKWAALTLACLACCVSTAPTGVKTAFGKSKRQVGVTETNPAAAVQAGSKYFQDVYVAMEKPGELQFGHVSETPNDWEQRFEKINLDNLKRQGKVRWGDKHGGYGEHYWDYNHAGHGDDGDGGESRHNEEYAYEDESRYVPSYTAPAPEEPVRGKREPELLKDVEFIDSKARSLILGSNSPKHGGNYRRANDYRGKREQTVKSRQKISPESLEYDATTGLLVDTASGMRFQLSPVEN